MMLSFLIGIFIVGCVQAIPIDNGFATAPEISCLSETIGLAINTKNAFGGHVYVKGRYGEDDCSLSGDNSLQSAEMNLNFDACGVKRERSLNPRGIFVSVTLVVKFHPVVLTKVDRAITIRCFYMEADKTVSQDIAVSDLTTGFATQVVPMPVCRYEILDSPDVDAEPLRAVLIGRKAYHKWTCDTETVDTFCMFIHTCYVEDTPGGNRIDTIDNQGCALDKFILNNLEYSSDLMAGVEAHVFKYPDRPNLFFTCQTRISVKEPNGLCPRPECDPLRRRRRSMAWHGDDGCWVNGDNLCAEADVTADMDVLTIQQQHVQQPPESYSEIENEQVAFNSVENTTDDDDSIFSWLFDLAFTTRQETPDALCATRSSLQWGLLAALAICAAMTYVMFKVMRGVRRARRQNKQVIVIYGDQIPVLPHRQQHRAIAAPPSQFSTPSLDRRVAKTGALPPPPPPTDYPRVYDRIGA